MPRTTEEQRLLQEFGQRIKTAREDREWTQEVLGEHAGMHRTYVGGIERGEKNLSLLKMNQLALALDMGFDGFWPYRGEVDKDARSGAKARRAPKAT